MTASVRLEGRGVHGGRPCTVTLHRRDGPIRLRRAGREIEPSYRRVVGTRGCTALGTDGARVAVVEHLLAALHVRGVWSGVLIETDADELPILDGSAHPWAEALSELGRFPEPPAALDATAVATADDGAFARLEPGPRSLDATIAFDHPAIGRQRWAGDPSAWTELLRARTFGFVRDADELRAAGLAGGVDDAGGGERANAIVYDSDAAMVPLRFADEPVRHKALDALGDLYLLGRPFAGRLVVVRAGHALHHRLVTELARVGAATDRMR